MNRLGYWLCLGFCLPFGCMASVPAAVYEPAPFSRYQPIIDRMPFGALPASFNPNADAEADAAAQKTAEQEKAEQQQVAKQLSFSALNITPRGTIAVGFTDRSVNPPQSHYLEVGTSAQGWTVVNADYDENWAQFTKDDVTITMHLNKGLIEGPPSADGTTSATNETETAVAATTTPIPTSTPPQPPTAAAARTTTIPGLVRRSAPSRATGQTPTASPDNTSTDTPPAKSYLERLRERKAQENAKKSAAEEATRESLQELARKIAQDELAKREQETAVALEELRMQQEIFQARQQEELAKEQREAAEAEQERLNAQEHDEQ